MIAAIKTSEQVVYECPTGTKIFNVHSGALLRVKVRKLECTFHVTNTGKRRRAPESPMNSEHLAEGPLPKDETSVCEPFHCIHVQLYTGQRSTGSESPSTLDTISACTRGCRCMDYGTFHLKYVQTQATKRELGQK